MKSHKTTDKEVNIGIYQTHFSLINLMIILMSIFLQEVLFVSLLKSIKQTQIRWEMFLIFSLTDRQKQKLLPKPENT